MKYFSMAIAAYLVLRVLTSQYDWGVTDYEYWLTIMAAISLAATKWEFDYERRQRIAKARDAARKRTGSSNG